MESIRKIDNNFGNNGGKQNKTQEKEDIYKMDKNLEALNKNEFTHNGVKVSYLSKEILEDVIEIIEKSMVGGEYTNTDMPNYLELLKIYRESSIWDN